MSEILFADDDPAMREMVGEVLRSAGYRTRLASDGGAALEEVRRSPPDLIILDYRMGPPDGLTVCRSIKSDPRLEHLPVLILTGERGMEDRIQGFDAGANDYLGKPFDSRELLARVRALLRLSRQGLDRNPTSGLPGGEAIEREFERRHSQGEPFTICYLDLDHFKPFGDRFGFSLGDRVIREIGQVLSRVSGPDVFAGHVGGDDFIMICPREQARSLVEVVQERFQGRLEQMLPAAIVTAGYYQGIDRDGRVREFPLTRIAAAIVHLHPAAVGTLAELGELVADVKRQAKQSGEGGIAEIDLPAPPDGAARG